MTPADRREFLRVLNGIAAVKRIELTAEALEIWWLALADWPLDEFKSAAVHLIKTCEFMPAPYDFEQLRKAARGNVSEAWVRVLCHAARGEYRHCELDADTERAVRALGGWQAVAHCETDKTHFLERRFAEHYAAMQDAADGRRALPNLASRLLVNG